MKLRNKKTDEIGYFCFANWDSPVLIIMDKNGVQLAKYNSPAELNSEWEDAPEEPKEYWFINSCGVVEVRTEEEQLAIADMHKQFGNYFETEEDAEEAVEKLKAMAKLKEFGFRFIDWELDMKTIADGKIWFDVGVNTEWDAEQLLELKPEAKELLDMLFGGEE